MGAEAALAMAYMGYSQHNLDVDPARSPKTTMPASTKGSCAATPSIEEWPQTHSQLKPVEKLAVKLVRENLLN